MLRARRLMYHWHVIEPHEWIAFNLPRAASDTVRRTAAREIDRILMRRFGFGLAHLVPKRRAILDPLVLLPHVLARGFERRPDGPLWTWVLEGDVERPEGPTVLERFRPRVHVQDWPIAVACALAGEVEAIRFIVERNQRLAFQPKASIHWKRAWRCAFGASILNGRTPPQMVDPDDDLMERCDAPYPTLMCAALLAHSGDHDQAADALAVALRLFAPDSDAGVFVAALHPLFGCAWRSPSFGAALRKHWERSAPAMALPDADQAIHDFHTFSVASIERKTK